VYCSEIKTNYLEMNKVAQRPSERVPSIVMDIRSASSNSSIKQCLWPFVDSMILHTDSTRKKGLRESEAFFKDPDNYSFPKLREKNHSEGGGIAVFILIAPNYSNLDWWNKFR